MKTEMLPTTIGALYRMSGGMDMNPPYQRPSGVWTIVQKQNLMDSILSGYDIPKFYLHRKSDKSLAVVDGKQRISAIVDFIDNKFPLGDFKVVEPWNKPTSSPMKGDYYQDFTQRWKTEFISSVVHVAEILLDSEPAEEERIIRNIFLRLNSGTPVSWEHLSKVKDQITALEVQA